MNGERQSPDAGQRDAFLEGEGDAYEERNSASEPNRELLTYLAKYLRAGDAVLEVGCGSGQNLLALERLVPGISCSGIDPSTKAIERGRRHAPNHRLEIATADLIPFAGPFVLVFFGFCLYLCDRSLLHAAVAQADSVLAGDHHGERGYLGILDFDPEQPHQRPYRHDPRIASFKMDYSALFLADPAYRLVEKVPFDHSSGTLGLANSPDDRVALWILEKNPSDAYPTRS